MSALRTLPTLERGRSGHTASPGAAYAILDGLFQQALLHTTWPARLTPGACWRRTSPASWTP
jgi:hypothetical protein